MIIFILFVVLFILSLIIWSKYSFFNVKFVKSEFENNISIGVCGDRGSGKDCLMSAMAYGTEHNSNIPLQDNTNVIAIKDIIVPNINRVDLINGKHLDVDRKKFEFLDHTTYISDGKLYFPCIEDSWCRNYYKGLPEELTIYRHLFDGNIHFNVQENEYLWKQVRNHVNHIFLCRGTIFLKFHVIIKLTYFERVKDYENGLMPIKNRVIGKNRNDMLIERSKRGLIKNCTIIIKRKKINHDTKYFRKVVFKNG